MTDTSKFHRKLIDKYGNLEIWEIDGEKLRSEKDIEFTNYGMWPDFGYIPKNELWLDVEKNPDERQFFIDHMLAQWTVNKTTGDNAKAIDKAYKVEVAERKKAGDKAKVFDTKGHPHPAKVHQKLLGKTDAGLEVWLINGRLVRSSYFIDFVDGGHHYVYPWVPEKEVWLDDDLSPKEYPYVLLHELNERVRMGQGWSYNRAHPDSSKIELYCHHHPHHLKEELSRLGWQT
ncbi:hypothetical protein HYS10_01780 [Candidatus Collierbacteria bacterium]|nr:hypothetical protein [Candidatus Collierbacteria bacterium]